mmetsp:Transcript_61138/g.120963  ORF Transcript_61138/g.120963 Transcript_61138/m.120963 type:complete len:232 (+) Transcript_61138:162-857(+)
MFWPKPLPMPQVGLQTLRLLREPHGHDGVSGPRFRRSKGGHMGSRRENVVRALVPLPDPWQLALDPNVRHQSMCARSGASDGFRWHGDRVQATKRERRRLRHGGCLRAGGMEHMHGGSPRPRGRVMCAVRRSARRSMCPSTGPSSRRSRRSPPSLRLPRRWGRGPASERRILQHMGLLQGVRVAYGSPEWSLRRQLAVGLLHVGRAPRTPRSGCGVCCVKTRVCGPARANG